MARLSVTSLNLSKLTISPNLNANQMWLLNYDRIITEKQKSRGIASAPQSMSNSMLNSSKDFNRTFPFISPGSFPSTTVCTPTSFSSSGSPRTDSGREESEWEVERGAVKWFDDSALACGSDSVETKSSHNSYISSNSNQSNVLPLADFRHQVIGAKKLSKREKSSSKGAASDALVILPLKVKHEAFQLFHATGK